LYLLFGLYGYHRNKQDLLAAVEEELKDMEKDKDVMAIQAMLPTRKSDEKEIKTDE
jgi:hypothetical protein